MIIPSEYDFFVHVKTDFERTFTLLEEGRTPVALTGASFEAYIKYSRYIDDALVLATEIVDSPNGVFRVRVDNVSLTDYFSRLRSVSFFYWKLFVSFDNTHPVYPNKRFLVKEGRVIPVFSE